jgi:hypothetical protein
MWNWKEEFVKCLEGSTSGHSQVEKALAMKAKHMQSTSTDIRWIATIAAKVWKMTKSGKDT